MKFTTPDELRAWLDRKPPPRDEPLLCMSCGVEVANDVDHCDACIEKARRGCPFDESLPHHEGCACSSCAGGTL